VERETDNNACVLLSIIPQSHVTGYHGDCVERHYLINSNEAAVMPGASTSTGKGTKHGDCGGEVMLTFKNYVTIIHSLCKHSAP
jgi:hypothetical protein